MVLLVLVVLGVTSSSEPTVTGRRVLVIGDSLTGGSRSEIVQTLRANGWDPRVAAISGSSMGVWLPLVADTARFARPQIAVIELGTNNCARGCRPLGGEIDFIVHRLLDAGVQKIFWLNVQEDSPYPISPRFVNDEIERAVVRWPQISMIDLSATFASHPEWHRPDHIHFNDQGRQIYANLLARALRSVRAQ